MNVLEWRISNFTYWDKNVHETQIECPASDFTFCPQVILYPRGLTGDEEYLVVHIIVLSSKSSNLLTGHMSFFDSSGCLICKENIVEKEKKGLYYEVLPKLKFDEVAALIRKNKVMYEDRLIIRCELSWNFDVVYCLYTMIDVYDACVKIDCKILEKLGYKKYILNIQCPIDGCEKFMYLCLTLEKTNFLITLKNQQYYERNFTVTTEASTYNKDTLIRTENNKHTFFDSSDWPFLTSLTREEVEGKYFTLLLRIKIIPSNKYRHQCGYFTRHSKEVDIKPADWLPQNTISKVSEGLTKSSDSASSNQPENSVSVLSKELMCLYQDHDFSDFQLICGEASFPTHKNILSARSPVFKAMLSSGMMESTSDSMDVPDLDVHTTARFLEFLYTGTVDDLQWESALKLYYAADKYQVCTLKEKCFSVLSGTVSISNVCDILSLADKHGDVNLTVKTHSFIKENCNEVLRSEEWKNFMLKEPLLAVKTITNFAEKNIFRIFSDS